MSIIRIGPLAVDTSGTGLLVESLSRHNVPTTVAPALSRIVRRSDALVALERLEEEEVAIFEPLVSRAKLGAILSAWNFDPVEDHPDGFDFGWVSALVNDFRGINDDLDTVEGVRGDHFTRLLSWQPRINPDNTALFAWITPGPLFEVAFRDADAAPRLAESFAQHKYDAVFLSGDSEIESEIQILTDFADGMRRGAELLLILATRDEGRAAEPPFVMHFTRGELFASKL